MTNGGVRLIEPRDVPACAALAAAHGGLDEAAWRLLLSLGHGVCVDAPGGGLAGAVTVVRFDGVAVVGSLAVSAPLGRRGLGSRLAATALQRAPGAVPLAVVGADAAGIAARLGLAQVDAVVRYEGSVAAGPPGAADGGVQLRPVGGSDFPALVALDEVAFGGSRRPLLERLLPMSERVCLAVRDGRVTGYGVAWGCGARVAVGPIVALEPAAAVALAAYLAPGHERPVRLEVPSGAAALQAWAAGAGLAVSEVAPVVTPGGARLPGRRERIHALAARELG